MIHDGNDKSLGEMFGAFLRQEAETAIESIQGAAKKMMSGFMDAVRFVGGILTSAAKSIGSAIGLTSVSKDFFKEDFSKEPEVKETQQGKRDIELADVRETAPARVIKISGEHLEQKAGNEEKSSVSVAAKKWGSNRPKSDFQDKVKYRSNNLGEVAEHAAANKNRGNTESTIEKTENQVAHHT
ncbi:MAG: hypothetical protein LEGION0398_MBIBDBAK_00150 [Legionellaceae bacterium]